MNNKLIIYVRGEYYCDASTAFKPNYVITAHGYIFDTTSDKTLSQANKPPGFVMTESGYIPDALIRSTSLQQVYPIYYIDYVNTMNECCDTVVVPALIDIITKIDEILDETELKDVLIYIDPDSAAKLIYTDELNTAIALLADKDINIDILSTDSLKFHGNLGSVLTIKLIDLAKHIYSKNNHRVYFNGVKNDEYNYWKITATKNPLLNFKQLFFTTNSKVNNNYRLYSILDYSPTDIIGKKAPDVTFGMVMLNQPVELIDDLIEAYYEIAKDTSAVFTINLKNLYARDTIHYHNAFQSNSFIYDYRNRKMVNINHEDLVYIIHPQGLVNQAMNKMGELYHILENFFSGKSKKMFYQDITNSIYTPTVDKKNNTKMTCHLPNGTKEITIPLDALENSIGNMKSIVIGLGKDTLDRNTFKSIEGSISKVYLIINKTDNNIYQYYTIVELLTGDTGIYCNYYSNKLFV